MRRLGRFSKERVRSAGAGPHSAVLHLHQASSRANRVARPRKLERSALAEPAAPELEARSEHAARAGKQQRTGEQGLGALRRDAERSGRLRGRTPGEDLDGPLEIVRVEAAADDLRQRAGAAADRERERRPAAGSCPRARGRRHPRRL